SHTFTFKNVGQSPVVISEIISGCGCIGKAASQKPVLPGKTGQVTISYDPAYRPGFFSKEIVVLSNNNQHYSRIWVEGNVIPYEHPIEEAYPYYFGDSVYFRLKVLAFGHLRPGESRKVVLHFANTSSVDKTIRFDADGDSRGLAYEKEVTLPAKGKGTLEFNFTMPFTVSNRDIEFFLHPVVGNRKMKESFKVWALKDNSYSQKLWFGK
ncbi:MAG TPA: DUF1573 domain-containing protein, partial [Parasegetibacter sp.]